MKQANLLFLGAIAIAATTLGVMAGGEETPGRTPLLAKPLLYSQAQLKYGLNIPFYYSRWSDRPLLINPELADPGREILYLSPVKAPWYTGWVHRSDMIKRMETVRKYGLDGFGIHPFNLRSSTDYILRYCDDGQVDGFTYLPLLYGNNVEELRATLRKLAASKTAVRVNGKNMVVYKYGTVPPVIKNEFKHSFIFLGGILPSYKWWEKYHSGAEMTKETEDAKTQLREFLREWDGGNWWYMYSWFKVDHCTKRLAWEFYQNFLMPLTQQVLAEPEFHGKYWVQKQ